MPGIKTVKRYAVYKSGLMPYVADRHATEFSEEEVREAIRRRLEDRARKRRRKRKR